MAELKEPETASEKLAAFIERSKKVLIPLLIVLICILIGYIITSVVLTNGKAKDLQTLDEITYTLTPKSSSLEDSEVELRRQNAIEQAAAYTMKGGIVGARANMLCADLTFQQKKYEESAEYWKNAAEKGKKTYIAPIAYYNLAVCYEELNRSDDAAVNYKLAADNKDFVLCSHAMFSHARVLDSQSKYEEASEAYKQLIDKFPENEWAYLAKSRIIALQNAGKIE
jgi:tetratricopeptide (TPR) repeat protein